MIVEIGIRNYHCLLLHRNIYVICVPAGGCHLSIQLRASVLSAAVVMPVTVVRPILLRSGLISFTRLRNNI